MSCFFFNDTATTEIYTLSLHDALPICFDAGMGHIPEDRQLRGLVLDFTLAENMSLHDFRKPPASRLGWLDRKSTRLNSSHANISYAVFCLKKKKPNSSLDRRNKRLNSS